MATNSAAALRKSATLPSAATSLQQQEFQWRNLQEVFETPSSVYGCASPNYMAQQVDINARMRAILIDWLIEAHHKFKLRDETLFLTVNLIDRFLEKQGIVRKKL